jgi:hypothetical protein
MTLRIWPHLRIEDSIGTFPACRLRAYDPRRRASRLYTEHVLPTVAAMSSHMPWLIRNPFARGALKGGQGVQDQQLAQKLSLLLAVVFVMLAGGAASAGEDALPSPTASGAAGTQVDPPKVSDTENQSEEDSKLSHWLTLPPTSGPAYWSSFDSGAAKNVRPGATFNRSNASSSSAATAPNDQLRVGNSYLGIQTKKNVELLQSLRRNDCPTDDECAEYSGLPRAEQPKTSVKNLKRPFIGLSITRPIE